MADERATPVDSKEVIYDTPPPVKSLDAVVPDKGQETVIRERAPQGNQDQTVILEQGTQSRDETSASERQAEREFFGGESLTEAAEREMTPAEIKDRLLGRNAELAKFAGQEGEQFEASVDEAESLLKSKSEKGGVPEESSKGLQALKERSRRLVDFFKGILQTSNESAEKIVNSPEEEKPKQVDQAVLPRFGKGETLVPDGEAEGVEAEAVFEEPYEYLGDRFKQELHVYETSFNMRSAEFDYHPSVLKERFSSGPIEGKNTLLDYLIHVNKRLERDDEWLRTETKEALKDQLQKTEELFKLFQNADTEEELRGAIRELRRQEIRLKAAELSAEFSWIQRMTVPRFMKSLPPDEMHLALKSGAEHPRFLLEGVLQQSTALSQGQEMKPLAEERAYAIPESLQRAFIELQSEDIPESHREQARRVANQVRNGFYAEAAESAKAFFATLEAETDVDIPPHVRSLETDAREQAALQRSRYENARRHQVEFVDSMLEREELTPEQRESLEARRRTEEIFEKGELVGDLTKIDGVTPYDGSGPAVGTFTYEGETRQGVVKFEFMDRQTRRGVTPGSGPLREVVGTMGYVGMGFFDTPAVVAKELRTTDGKEYGYSSITQLIEGKPATRSPEFFLEEGESVRSKEQIQLLAVVDYILHRVDGAPRNLMYQAESGNIVPIDFGSDFPSSSSERFSSVAMYVTSELQEKIPLRVQAKIRAWIEGPQMQAYLQAVETFPEDMTMYRAGLEKRAADLLAQFDASGKEMKAIHYDPETNWHDFGRRVMGKISKSKRLSREAENNNVA